MTSQIWILLLVVLFAGSVRAQITIPKCDGPLPPASGCLKIEYDRFKDSTLASVMYLVVDKGTDERVVLMFMSSFTGQQLPQRASTAELAIGVLVVGTLAESSPMGLHIEVLADNTKRWKLALVAVGTGRRLSNGGVSEQHLAILPAPEFVKLTDAKRLEMRIGRNEFLFTDTMRVHLLKFGADYYPFTQ